MPLPLAALTLAGGQGRRLAGLTGGVPKQFWTPDGGPTLVERTLERLAPLCRIDRRVTVVDQSQRDFVVGLRNAPSLGQVVYQPGDRGTAAAVLLGLSVILETTPDAIVVLTPADHHIGHPEEFRVAIQTAAARVRRYPLDTVLFGAPPATASTDYGWILPPAGRRVRTRTFNPVGSFVEKPEASAAEQLRAFGGVWSTMVVVSRASRLFDRTTACLPEAGRMFAEVRRRGPESRARWLAARYAALPQADFSRDVLACSPGLTFYAWSSRIEWSDLGTPQRVTAWMERGRLKSSSSTHARRLTPTVA